MTGTLAPGSALPDRLPDVERIAVLRANAIGDYLMSLPALHALTRAYPRARLTLVGAPWHQGFLAGRPGPVSEVLVLPRVDGLAGITANVPPASELPRFLAALRERGFDLAVQLHGGGATSNPLVRQFGAGTTVGLRAPGAAALDRWVPYRYYQPEVSRYLEVVALVGATGCAEDAELAVTDVDRAQADAVLPPPVGRGWVALHPGATDPRRRWPPQRFAAVGDALADAGFDVAVTGSAAERELVSTVVSAMRRPVLPLVGAVGLGGLAGVLARCELAISNDTGPLHLARAVGTPTVGIYWCGNAINAGPATRSRHRPVLSWTVHCPCCGADCTRDLYPSRPGGPACGHRPSFVADVQVDEIVDEALDLLTGPAG